MEFDAHDYIDGKSHVMAIAIRRMFGGHFALLCEDDGMTSNPETGEPTPVVYHTLVILPDGSVAYVDGVRENSESLDQWETMNDFAGAGCLFSVVSVDDERDFENFVCRESLPLDSFAEPDIADAQDFFLIRNQERDIPSNGRYLH